MLHFECTSQVNDFSSSKPQALCFVVIFPHEALNDFLLLYELPEPELQVLPGHHDPLEHRDGSLPLRCSVGPRPPGKDIIRCHAGSGDFLGAAAATGEVVNFFYLVEGARVVMLWRRLQGGGWGAADAAGSDGIAGAAGVEP